MQTLHSSGTLQQWLGPAAALLHYKVTFPKDAEFKLMPYKQDKNSSVSLPYFPSLTAALAMFFIRLLQLKKVQIQAELKEVHWEELFNILLQPSHSLFCRAPAHRLLSFDISPSFSSYFILYLKFPLRLLCSFSSMAKKAFINLVKVNAVYSCLCCYGRTGMSLPVRGNRSFASQRRWPLSILPRLPEMYPCCCLGHCGRNHHLVIPPTAGFRYPSCLEQG